MKNFACRSRLMERSRLLLGLALVAVFLSSAWPNRVEAAGGSLDPTFGMGGKVTTDFFNGLDVAQAIAIQPDGKIIAAGSAQSNFPAVDFALARYNSDGTPDANFGMGGKVTTDFSGTVDGANAVALQADGKIVAAGFVFGNDAGLARYNSDGTLDATFGTGGKVRTIIPNRRSIIYSMAIQPDNKIVVAGSLTNSVLFTVDVVVMRYNPDGSLDATFGTGGQVITDFGFAEEAYAMALQPDNKIVVAGIGHMQRFLLVRYNSNGSLDGTFGMGGQAFSDFGNTFSAAVHDLALKPDGKIIAVGYAGFTGAAVDFGIIQYNADGTPDANFGTGGQVITDFAGGADFAYGIVRQSSGKFVVAGNALNGSNTDFALARYNEDGTLDLTFGMDGKVMTDYFGRDDTARDLALMPDGRLVAAGDAVPSDNQKEFALARYDNSTFDICLQDDRTGDLLQFNSITGDYQFTNCRKRLTFVGRGTVRIRACKVELQASQPGRTLTALANTCVRTGSATLVISATPITYSISDSNITNNTCACR